MHPNDGRVVSNFVVQALLGEPITIYGDGLQTRSFCYVNDLIAGLVALMESDDAVVGPINLGNPTESTMRELAEAVIAVTGSKSTLVQRPILNWQPNVKLVDGLRKTADYFEKLLASGVDVGRR
jgi:UDP-glucuronate decarboxylase